MPCVNYLILFLSDGRQDEAPCQPAPEGEAGASARPNTASQRSLHSHTGSGLSESSDSLTDVSEYLVIVYPNFNARNLLWSSYVPSVY